MCGLPVIIVAFGYRWKQNQKSGDRLQSDTGHSDQGSKTYTKDNNNNDFSDKSYVRISVFG